MITGRNPADPTGTLRLRRRYEAAMISRFRRLRALVRRAILIEDVFGLREPRRLPRPIAGLDDLRVGDARMDSPGRGAFSGFTHSEEKAREFMLWLRRQSRLGILDIREGTPVERSLQGNWQKIYIDSAYRQGLRDAEIEKKQALPDAATENIQTAFLRPVHADRVGRIYTRNLEDLNNITEAMSSQIREVLAEGVLDSRNPNQIARKVVERVDKIGITRARTLARTEIVAAHAEATLASFEEAGIHGVSNQAEFMTSEDDRVCQICASMSGDVYTLEDAKGVIPVHPNCRCRWLPVIVPPTPDREKDNAP